MDKPAGWIWSKFKKLDPNFGKDPRDEELFILITGTFRKIFFYIFAGCSLFAMVFYAGLGSGLLA